MWTLYGLSLAAAPNSHRHLHGGPPASVGSVEIRVEAHEARTLLARQLVLLHANAFEPEDRWPDQKPLSLVETWWVAEDDGKKLAGALTLQPGDTGILRLTFPAEQLYQSFDRWAVDVTLSIDGTEETIRVPLRVMRVTPRRR